ncbi:MAG: helix-turn-helix domain-containing protein [bacterium]|nr:helix-turn-helix domain-containing protein [bacterium]
MKHLQLIQRSIDQIEENLQADLSVEELAASAGYSASHFGKLFQEMTGLSVTQFILRRRLLHAIYEMKQSKPRIHVALTYGFETYAGFYKAFCQEFSCTPSEYLNLQRAKKPGHWNLFKEEPLIMNHRKAAEVLKHWHLEEEKITDIYYESTGNRAENAYAVGSHYVLKFTSHPGRMQRHIALSRALTSQGLPTSRIIVTADGKDYVQKGDIFCYVMHRVYGQQLRTTQLYAEDGQQLAYHIGTIIGQIQLSLRTVNVSVPSANPFTSILSNTEEASEMLQLSSAECHSFCNSAAKLFTSLPRQTIHRDLNPSNLLLSDNKWGVIDFDLAEENVRIFDPCYAATAILSEDFAHREKWLKIYCSLFRGYDSVCHMTQQEKDAVPYLILSNQFSFISWFARQKCYPEILQTNLEMTKWLMDHFDKLTLKNEPSQ